MLGRFAVKNFRAFKEEVTLDLQATSVSEHTDSLLKAENGEMYLPVSVLYGPNGSGKSTLIDALSVLVLQVIRPIKSVRNGGGLDDSLSSAVIPFRLDEDSQKAPTEFELVFLTKFAKYRYVLHVLKEKVVYEYLDAVKMETNRRSTLLVRKDGEIQKCFVRGITGRNDISDRIPLLSFLGITYRNNAIVDDCINWFDNKVICCGERIPPAERSLSATSNETLHDFMRYLINQMDLNVNDFEVIRKEDNQVRIKTHHVVDNTTYMLDLRDESSGTRKIFGLLPILCLTLICGATLIIDEMDASLHPKLLEFIIRIFTNHETNPNGSQLITTSHELFSMNSDLLRRDEIWFVNKNSNQTSNLLSLAEVKDTDGKSIRKDVVFYKQYIENRFGAIPDIQPPKRWNEKSKTE